MARTPAAPADPSTLARVRSRQRLPARAATPRPAEAGDTVSPLTARGAEADRVRRRSSTTTAVQSMVVGDLLAQAGHDTPAGEALRQLQTLIAGASPDEVEALRNALFEPGLKRSDRPAIDPDTELSPGWREGAYPYKNCCRARAMSGRSTGCRWTC
tara:strand:+ start:139 stop:609 length:471 start_codon:yes stop_codon:yes gene_type:complete